MVVSTDFFRISVLVLLALLSACSVYTLPGGEPGPAPKQPESTVVVPPVTAPRPGPSEPSASAAWRPLLAKAEQATARGDYEQALALLERAQRIDPDSAQVYLCMARTHQARGDTAQARATAARGLLYCSGSAECDALRAYTH